MKYLKIILACFCLIILIAKDLLAQSKTNSIVIDTNLIESSKNYDRLSIGDTIPDVVFNQIMHYSAKTAKLSDFLESKKLIILDFWATGCSGCIDLFPHLQSLANKFKKDLQIILVDGKTKAWHDNETKIKRVIDNVEKRSNMDINLPIVLNCEILDKYFPCKTIPHEVWITKEGKVLAITGGDEVNYKNIESILAGKKVSMRMKKDVLFDIQHNSLLKLVYSNNNLRGNIISSSILYQGLIDGLGSKMGFRGSSNRKRFTGWFFINLPLLAIYKFVYPLKLAYPDNRIIILSKDSSKFIKRYRYDIDKHNLLYSFEISVPSILKKQLLKDTQHALEQTFHFKITNEKRKVNCLVLKATPKLKNHISKGGKKEYVMGRIDHPKYIRNFPISELVLELNHAYINVPVIDETGIKRGIDMKMPDKLTQENIIQALKRAGFEVIPTKRKLQVAVISDL